MQSSTIKFWVCSGSLLFYLLAPKPTTAQIVPDTTLPNNSIVLPNSNTFEIKDGTTVGNNLFHSFEKFSISDGGSANFNNALTIQNIITRVTGKDISNINGKISANGTANLFLLNPNGIIFGKNASLNIGGSFIATTASSLKFADGTEFRTDGTQTTPLLTMSVPMGLQFGANPQRVVNQSVFKNNNNEVGLEVKPGKTLALVGGDVVLDGGVLIAPGGRIELGSVAGNNSVSLKQIDQSWVLGYEGIQNFQDISLSNAAYVNTEGQKGGDIQIQGRNVTLTGGSQVVAAAQGGQDSSEDSRSVRTSQPGNIKINALEKLELVVTPTDKFATGIFNQVRRGSEGGAGSLQIETKQLIVRGAQISATTDGGQGVDLQVNASESVELEGLPRRPSGIFTQARSNATGNGGSVTINTKRLTVQGSRSRLATTTSGAGNAGNLTINASESVLLKGASSGLYTQVEGQVQGNEARGNAGDLTITTKTLEVHQGAQISAATLSAGNGGNLTINARESVQVIGTETIHSTPFFSRLSAGATFSGKAGNLNIRTPSLNVQDGGQVTVGGSGTGPAGNLNVTADFINLNQGSLTAVSKSGYDGNISLQANDILLMRRGSVISNFSGTQQTAGIEGNLNANVGFLVATPNENNDIITNSFGGSGGEINIRAFGIIGIAPLSRQELERLRPNDLDPRQLSTNDIIALSQSGPSFGISSFNIDLGLVELPALLADTAQIVDTSCAAFADGKGSEFTVTGRGGLPPSPNEPLSTDVIWSDTRTSAITSQQQRSEKPSTKPPTKDDAVKIVPATGWVFDGKGNVTLISHASNANNLGSTPACQKK